MKTLTVVLHLEIEQDEDDPALWNWHELLALNPSEVATVDEVFEEDLLVALEAALREYDVDDDPDVDLVEAVMDCAWIIVGGRPGYVHDLAEK